MAPSARTTLSDLPKGHRFPETTFRLRREDLARYLDAVEDRNDVYAKAGVASPLAVAARALASLLGVVELPPGSLHTSQEVDARRAIRLDEPLVMDGVIAQRSERAGLVISVIEFKVTPKGAAEPALSGRTTVMAPVSGQPSGGSK